MPRGLRLFDAKGSESGLSALRAGFAPHGHGLQERPGFESGLGGALRREAGEFL